jgi:hypothetical protein
MSPKPSYARNTIAAPKKIFEVCGRFDNASFETSIKKKPAMIKTIRMAIFVATIKT